LNDWECRISMKKTPVGAVVVACTVLLLAGVVSSAGRASASLTVVVELPIAQTADPEPQSILNAVEMAVDDAGSVVCGLPVSIAVHNYSSATSFADPDLLAANAAADVADPSVVGIVGPYDSPSAVALLRTVQAAHLAVVSPSNTDPQLTKPPAASALYPDGFRDYARVITTDDVEGGQAAKLAQTLGAHSSYVVSDGSKYGATATAGFLARAGGLALPVVGTADVGATPLAQTVAKVKKLNPDLVYYGGTVAPGSKLLVALRRARYNGLFVGGAGIRTQAFLSATGSAAEGAYATRPGISAASLPNGAAWVASYVARFAVQPEFYAASAYASTQLLLTAIATVCQEGGNPFDRSAVSATMMATHDLSTLLGATSLDANGDTLSLGTSVYRVTAGIFTLSSTVN
jgi:branched-chain amino acid transport system substrate-binding protein